jgi:hypothetical protein
MDLAATPYVSLATWRKDGREVRTPVWVAAAAGRYYVVTAGAAGKVKRLRANPRVRIAPCDARGRLRGEWVAGQGRILSDSTDIDRAHRALRSKYGWQMWLLDLGARLSGRDRKRAWLELELPRAAADSAGVR